MKFESNTVCMQFPNLHEFLCSHYKSIFSSEILSWMVKKQKMEIKQ